MISLLHPYHLKLQITQCQNFEIFKPGHLYVGHLDKPCDNYIIKFYNESLWYNNPKYMDTDSVSGAPAEYNSEIHGLDNLGNIVEQGSYNDVSGYYGKDGVWISLISSGD